MHLIDITNWASNELKIVCISPIFVNAPFAVKVKKFEPEEGDMLEERWVSTSVVKSHPTPQYALSDMRETATMLVGFIEKNIATFIIGVVPEHDALLWDTYHFAFAYTEEVTVGFSCEPIIWILLILYIYRV